MNDRIRLLNPGPVTLTPRVRRALNGPDLCHRQPEFTELQNEVRERLVRVYPGAADEFTAVLFTGSGTAAVEAMVGSLVERSDRALVVENGVYGERIASMLRAQGKEHDVVRLGWTEPIDLAMVGRKLESDSRLTHVIAVHHETTTGRLNDVAGLGELCRKRDVALLLDSVSSFAGEQIDFRSWNLEACASTANKCLHGVPGICFVLVRNSALADRPSGACSVYLDLFRNHEVQSKGYPLFTPSVQVLFALREALRELSDKGGAEQRQRHYQELSALVREGLRERGVELFLRDREHFSSTLSSFLLPKGVRFRDLYDRLQQGGFVIYPGQAALQESIFRVAVMGDLSLDDMREFLSLFDVAVARDMKREVHV
jgi:2-aminoethylphosphonate-pyruvate transaminase